MPKGVLPRHPAELVADRLGEIEQKYHDALTSAEQEAIAAARSGLYRIGNSTSRQWARTAREQVDRSMPR